MSISVPKLRCGTFLAAVLALAVSVAALPGNASAQDDEDIADLVSEFEREQTHSVYGTARIVHFPGVLLDIWFARHANHWDGQANMAYGLEYVYRKTDSFDLQIGVFWTDLSMQDKFWLEEDKADNLAAADYTKQGLSTLAVEANFFGYHDFVPEFGIFYGGGVWFGGVLGEIKKANINEACAARAEAGTQSLDSCNYATGAWLVEDGVPPVMGFMSLSVGLRAEIEKRFVIKLEGGFKGYLFLGLSMGAQFW